MSIVRNQGDRHVRGEQEAPVAPTGDRRGIYYWKCDRASAFHSAGPHFSAGAAEDIAATLTPVLNRRMDGSSLVLQRANSPGNHYIYSAEADGTRYLVRVESGPERDDYMEIEAHVLDQVRQAGVRTPLVYLADSSRTDVPFAFQVMQFLPFSDLNSLYKSGELVMDSIASQIGASVATWQSIRPDRFGPFNPAVYRAAGALVGLHRSYASYFYLNLESHLAFLVRHEFLSSGEKDCFMKEIDGHADLLDQEDGCLVHKDLALWNVLGTEDSLEAVIDWDDAIAGDPTDDLSLLACFHGHEVVGEAVRGYQSIRPLPKDFTARFWLHLLRNMIVKATIRVGAGYFEREQDFFLNSNRGRGMNLREFTYQRLWTAYEGVKSNHPLSIL